MIVTALDTHELVKDLQAAGFTDAQAEVLARALRQAHDLDLTHLATKADLSATQAAFRADLTATKADLTAAIAETKVEMMKWLVGTVGVQTVVIIGAVVTLARLLAH